MIYKNIVYMDGIVVIRLFGNIVNETINEFENIFKKEILVTPGVLALDFLKVKDIDSFGIYSLIKLYKKTTFNETSLVLFNLDNRIKELLQVLNLYHKMNIIKDENIFNMIYACDHRSI